MASVIQVGADLRRISLAGATVVIDGSTDAPARRAALELLRYLPALTGTVSRQASAPPQRGPVVLLSDRPATAATWNVTLDDLGSEGHVVRVVSSQPVVLIAANRGVGLLYGVYTLLQQMGMGFWLGGDSYPDRHDTLAGTVPDNLSLVQKPAFAVRGQMLHYNFMVGCTTWGLSDYQFYFDQLARSRCNLLLIHWYDDEPLAAAHDQGRYFVGGRAANSLSRSWGAPEALRTSEFWFGSGECFDEELFGSPMAEQAADALEEIQRSEQVFAQATSYARELGVQVAAGFEEPRGCPTDEQVVRRFVARVEQFLSRNPDLACFALWNHEGGGCVGTPPPEPGTAGHALYERHRSHFAYLGSPARIWEAIRFGRFARIAYDVMRRVNPALRMVVVGWGGDRWMLFADYCLGYDTFLPEDVIFTCHDNIDASLGVTVSEAWGRLPARRQRWAMPWAESDLSDCWTRQPIVESLHALAPDALAKGCQGLLLLSWRTRDIEEELGFAAGFAWNAKLTAAAYYADRAARLVGAADAVEMEAILEQLQKLGSRWTGVPGTAECGMMRWVQWSPPIPHRLDAAGVRHLVEMGRRAVTALATVPADQATPAGDGAFHLRHEQAEGQVRLDMARPGVAEFQHAIARLQAVAGAPIQRVQQELVEIRESLFPVRTRLIEGNVPLSCYSPMDEFLLHLHHMARHGEVPPHFEALQVIRTQLAAMEQRALAAGRVRHLEAIQYLRQTLEFVLNFDQVVLLLMPDGEVERALTTIRQAIDRGDQAEAAAQAERAWSRLVDAGITEAIGALQRRLTVRGDWGVLATVNVKPMAAYRQTLNLLLQSMSAPPPVDLLVRSDGLAVRLQWSVPAEAKVGGHVVYRSRAGQADWHPLVKVEASARPCLYMDAALPGPGLWRYAVATVDAQGHEGPRSHAWTVRVGDELSPQVVAAKPRSWARAGESVPVRVVVRSEAEVARVTLRYRRPDGPWQTVPMLPRFRRSWHTVLPAEAVTPGVLQWYVEAVDVRGGRGVWPATSDDGVPWTLAVPD